MTSLAPLFDEFSDGVCISNAAGSILYMNPAAQRLLDVDFRQNPGIHLCELLCGNLNLANTDKAVVHCPFHDRNNGYTITAFQGKYGPKKIFSWKQSHVYKFEQWKDLRVRCVKAPHSLLADDGEQQFFTLIEDVTAESELERHKEEWRSMIAHDLRAPLTNITGVLAILAGIPLGRPLEASEVNLVQTGLRASRHMVGLLNLFLEVAKLDAGVMPVHLEDISVSDIIRQAIEDQSAIIQEKKMDVKVSVPDDLFIRADTELFLRVIINVLSNGLKFTPAGGRISIFASEPMEGKVSVFIKDTGPGIAQEDIPHVFDRYYQAAARRQGRTIGNGLGLTFCHEALKAMKGEIAVSSIPGSGTEFIIRMPVAVRT